MTLVLWWECARNRGARWAVGNMGCGGVDVEDRELRFHSKVNVWPSASEPWHPFRISWGTLASVHDVSFPKEFILIGLEWVLEPV